MSSECSAKVKGPESKVQHRQKKKNKKIKNTVSVDELNVKGKNLICLICHMAFSEAVGVESITSESAGDKSKLYLTTYFLFIMHAKINKKSILQIKMTRELYMICTNIFISFNLFYCY